MNNDAIMDYVEKTEKKISDIHNIVNIQGQSGNWDYNGYMLGLFNGIELASSIMEDRAPQFRTLSKYNLFIRIKRWLLFRFTRPCLAELYENKKEKENE